MTGLEQQGCFRTKGASLTEKNLDMFENSELSQNIVNENNGRKGGEEVNTARLRWRESLDVIFKCDESYREARALTSKEMGSNLDFWSLRLLCEKKTPKHKATVTLTRVVALKLACVEYNMQKKTKGGPRRKFLEKGEISHRRASMSIQSVHRMGHTQNNTVSTSLALSSHWLVNSKRAGAVLFLAIISKAQHNAWNSNRYF